MYLYNGSSLVYYGEIFKTDNFKIISLATFYFKDKPEGFRDIVIRLSDELHENGFKVTSLLFLDAANIVK